MTTIVAVRSCDCAILGPEMLILQQARYMADAGYRFVIANLWDGFPPQVALHEEAQRQGLESVVISSASDYDPIVLRRLRNALIQIKPDLVHTHGAKAEIASVIATLGLRIPLVGSFYGVQTRRPLGAFFAESTSLLSLRVFRRVLANAEMLRDQLVRVGLPSSRVEVHHSTIDSRARILPREEDRRRARAELGLRADQPTITTIARLDIQKGHPFVLAAMALLHDEFPDLTYLIVGEGITKPTIERKARELGLRDNVRFLGYRSDLDHVCAATDILVAPSLSEGTSVTLLEAMSYATPIVATAVGGTPELIADGVNGLLIPPRDTAAVACAVSALLRDPARRQSLGGEGRRLSLERFSSQAGGERLERTFLSVLNRTSAQDVMRSTP